MSAIPPLEELNAIRSNRMTLQKKLWVCKIYLQTTNQG